MNPSSRDQEDLSKIIGTPQPCLQLRKQRPCADLNQRPRRPARQGGHSFSATYDRSTRATPRRPGHPEHPVPNINNLTEVNAAHARQRGPGEQANAELKTWRILRKIRSCPRRVSELVAAVQPLMIASA
jgi:hypothetical protein